MKQVFQDLNTGEQRIDNVPTPNINKNQVLIQTSCSLISSGTEGMLISFGKSNYLIKLILLIRFLLMEYWKQYKL